MAARIPLAGEREEEFPQPQPQPSRLRTNAVRLPVRSPPKRAGSSGTQFKGASLPCQDNDMEAKIGLARDDPGYADEGARIRRNDLPAGGPACGSSFLDLWNPAALASQPSSAGAAASEPDFNVAYVLATASYCAYAVGAVDSGGEKLADQGRKRAFDCLTAAVEADPGHLGALKVEAADVEAWSARRSPRTPIC